MKELSADVVRRRTRRKFANFGEFKREIFIESE